MTRPRVTVEKAASTNFPRGSSCLLAVSGGIDSMVLLSVFASKAVKMGSRIEVAHVDHGLRKESASDARFVREVCEKLKVPFHLKTATGGPGKRNLEDWGRQLRYSFFAAVRAERGLDFVVTAHTANDVAETFLMRLVSNKELTSILPHDESRHVIRPFLSVPRKEIERYAKKNGIKHVEDASNSDTGFLRNRVRHVLLPLLEKEFDPRIIEVLSLRAEAVAADNSGLYLFCEPALIRLSELKFGSRAWLRAVRKELEVLPDESRWRLAERLLKPMLGFNLGREHSSRLLKFLQGGTVGVELPGGIKLRAKSGGIIRV